MVWERNAREKKENVETWKNGSEGGAIFVHHFPTQLISAVLHVTA
jgi:hypothetical protein